MRDSFGSKIGLILATAGSAVGLGNVWRFPFMTGQNGGAAFIVIYIFYIIFNFKSNICSIPLCIQNNIS